MKAEVKYELEGLGKALSEGDSGWAGDLKLADWSYNPELGFG